MPITNYKGIVRFSDLCGAEIPRWIEKHLITYQDDPDSLKAFGADVVTQMCQRLLDGGVTINRPPRDGHMAFVRSPDNISIELLQKGDNLPEQEPWASMPNSGHW